MQCEMTSIGTAGRSAKVDGRRLLAAAALAGLLTAGAVPVFGQCQYEIIGEIKGPDCGLFGVPWTRARGMNNHGHVVGDRDDCFDLDATHVFIWKQETGRVDLPTPANVFQAFGRDINDDGFIVGEHDILGPTAIRAFVWNPDTQEYTYIEPLNPGGSSYVSSINNKGIAAGRRTVSPQGVSPHVDSAFLWNIHTGEVIDLGVPNGQHSMAEDVNDNGDTAGWSGGIQSSSAQNLPSMWAPSESMILVLPLRALYGAAFALNSRCDVIGRFKLPGLPLRGFLWRGDPAIELAPEPPFEYFAPFDISDVSQIVGRLSPGSDPGLWQKGKFHLLTDHIVSIPPTISSINAAIAVNNNGAIVAEAVFFGAGKQAVVLQPVDVPTGDLDFDCKVGVPDLLALLKQLFTPGGHPSADLNGDGIVNVLDILVLLQNWSPQ